MDVAAEVVTYLGDVTGFPWYHDVPKHAPEEFGTATRNGGPTELVRDTATMTIMVHAASRGRASDLAVIAKNCLMAMPWDRPDVFNVEVMGDGSDKLDGRYRRRITAEIIVND